MLRIREGVVEPVYAASSSPTVLFVLSRELELELRLAKDGSPTGRPYAGSFDVSFKRTGKIPGRSVLRAGSKKIPAPKFRCREYKTIAVD